MELFFVAFVVGSAAVLYVCVHYARVRRSQLRCFVGTGADLKRVFSRMATARRPPLPPFWAFGSHAQFFPWLIYNVVSELLGPLAFEVQHVRVRGLVDKSKPEGDANLRRVEDIVLVNYFPAVTGSDTLQLPLDSPAIFIDPGLTCTAQDVPGSSFLRLAVSRGFRVVVMERRGHGRPLASPRFNLFGDSDDFEQVYDHVRKQLPLAPFFWIGFSSGSKLVIEGLGKFDERRKRGGAAPTFVAAACVCPGYNLETCFKGFRFPYTRVCLSSVKSKFLARNAALLSGFNREVYQAAMSAPDLQSLLALVPKFAGYPSAESYFRAENPVLFAPQITTPCLIVNSADDPLTVVQNAFGTLPGSDGGPTFVEMVEQSPCGMLLITPSGSHCPFLDGIWWPFATVPRGLGSLICSSWADRCILEFYEGYLAESSLRS